MPPFARSLTPDELAPSHQSWAGTHTNFPLEQTPDLFSEETPVVPPDMAPDQADLSSGGHTRFPLTAPGVTGELPPILTNIPSTAENAANQGGDVYFLADTPEAARFLKTGAGQGMKYVIQDIPPRPSESQMSLTEAWTDFKKNEFKDHFGFDPDQVNPGKMGKQAYDDYIAANIGHLAPQQIAGLDPKFIKQVYSMADKQRLQATRIGVDKLNQANQIRNMFARDFLQKRALANRTQPRDPLTAVKEPGTDRTILMPESQAIGMEPGVKPSTKEPSFHDEKLREIWDSLDDQSKLRAVGALPADKDLTEKNILDVYGNIFTDSETKKALQPIVNEITKRAAEKNKNPATPPMKILPQGSVQIGTLNGKPVYQTPDGKRVVMK